MSPAHPTALPTFYYVVFGLYEPLLTSLGFMGALFDPKTVSDQRIAPVEAITSYVHPARPTTSRHHGPLAGLQRTCP